MDPHFPIPHLERLPKRIQPCPIVEAILQITLEETAHSWQVLPGIVYLALKEKYPQPPVSLPVNSIPEQIRLSDLAIQQQPHLDFQGEDHLLRLGPRVLSLNFNMQYPGWSTISFHLKWVLEKLSQAQIIPSVRQVGLRYVDFFSGVLLKDLRLTVKVDELILGEAPTSISLILNREKFDARLQIHTGAELSVSKKNGSVLDVDVLYKPPQPFSLQECVPLFEDAHKLQKEIFFGLLTEQKLNELNPEYD